MASFRVREAKHSPFTCCILRPREGITYPETGLLAPDGFPFREIPEFAGLAAFHGLTRLNSTTHTKGLLAQLSLPLMDSQSA